MGRKGQQTREQILAVAEEIILNRGYAGASLDEIITRAGITKGGFFYHFEGKKDLARSLMQRYLVQDAAFFDGLIERARALTEDPLQQLLIFLKLMAEAMQDLPGTHPGCLVASFTYESQQFDDEVHRLNAEGILSWRSTFAQLIVDAAERHPMHVEQPPETLADMLTTVIEGGIILSRVLDDRTILPAQLLQYRNYVRFVFGDL